MKEILGKAKTVRELLAAHIWSPSRLMEVASV